MEDNYYSKLSTDEDLRREIEVDSSHEEYSRRFDLKMEAQNCEWLSGFQVSWIQPSTAATSALKTELDSDCDEHATQKVIEDHPLLLAKHLRGGHARWVIPKVRLGSQHVTDFLMGEASSVGLQWCAVELESPKHKLFTNDGNPTAKLTHAVRQIQDWRIWLSNNKSYACRPKCSDGLGLHDIDSTVPGLIIIGRRNHGIDRPELRRKYLSENNIAIHTYDWLLNQI